MFNHSDILYFDYAATTPCAPEVAESIHASLVDGNLFGNASSAHALAYSAENSIDHARSLVARLIGGDTKNIIFTSGATESNNLALIGLSKFLLQSGKPHIVSSSTEHKAVLDTLKYLKSAGHSVTLIDPDIHGRLSVEDIEKAVNSKTGLISIMHVNNETGAIQDITEIGKLAKQSNALFHVDAAQSAGKLAIDVEPMNIDLLSMCAHKFYGPKGVGALYISDSANPHLSPLLKGGGQERGLRPGTYANHQIIGFGKTIELALNNMKSDLEHASVIRTIFIDELQDVILHINCGKSNVLPNILNISIDGVDSTTLLTSLQNKVALATGSACNSGTVSASHVLEAMGLRGASLENSIRISFGRFTTTEQAKRASEIIRTEIARIKSYF